MATKADLDRFAVRSLTGSDQRRLEETVAAVADVLEVEEQILAVTAGDWFGKKRCVVVATSRRVIVADPGRVDVIPYERLLDVEFSESWRKARLLLRAQGVGAEVKGMHLDQARELYGLINTARQTLKAS